MLKKYIEADRRAVELFKQVEDTLDESIVAAVLSGNDPYPATMKVLLERIGNGETLHDRLMGLMKGLTLEEKALTIAAFQVRSGIAIDQARRNLPEMLKEAGL